MLGELYEFEWALTGFEWLTVYLNERIVKHRNHRCHLCLINRQLNTHQKTDNPMPDFFSNRRFVFALCRDVISDVKCERLIYHLIFQRKIHEYISFSIDSNESVLRSQYAYDVPFTARKAIYLTVIGWTQNCWDSWIFDNIDGDCEPTHICRAVSHKGVSNEPAMSTTDRNEPAMSSDSCFEGQS